MVPDGGLPDLVVDGQVGSVVFGEGGPGNWDFIVTCTGITGQEEKRQSWDQVQCTLVQSSSSQFQHVQTPLNQF